MIDCARGRGEPPMGVSLGRRNRHQREWKLMTMDDVDAPSPAAHGIGGPPRGRPFEPGTSGNPKGRPRGSRNGTTMATEVLLDGEAERLTRMAVDKALAGDRLALRLCLERILPPRRDRPIAFDLPEIATVGDAVKASSAVLSACAAGNPDTGRGRGRHGVDQEPCP